MEAFDYAAPKTLSEAFTLLGNGKRTLLLAGGTDVIVQLREGRRHCDQLIDLKHIPDLMTMAFQADGSLDIGAATPLAEIYENPDVRKTLPALVDAAFRLKKDEAGQAPGDTPTQIVVFRVNQVNEPTFDANSADAKTLADTLKSVQSDELLGQYIQRLQTDIGTSINQTAFDQVTGAAPLTN